MVLLAMRDVQKRRGAHILMSISSLVLQQREQVAITGRSGAGKTTLLHLISGVLAADSGSIVLAGEELVAMREAQRDVFRARTIGYVFQTFNLLQGLSALENVMVAAMFAGKKNKIEHRAKELLVRLGLQDKMQKRPADVSVGEQQRIAVARALINNPALLLADEPTANLDAESAQLVLQEIRELSREQGTALLVVTHDLSFSASFDRVIPVANIIQTISPTLP